MSTKFIAQAGSKKGIGFDLLGYQIIAPIKNNNYSEEVLTLASTASVATGSVGASTISVEITASNSERYVMDELYLEFLVTNNHATDDATFLNPFDILSSISMFWNNEKVEYCDSFTQLKLRVNNHLLPYGKDVDSELIRCRTESTYTFNGETATALAASTKQFQLPLSWVFPHLHGMVWPLLGIKTLKFQFAFQTNIGTAVGNTLFVKNATSNANIYPSLALSNIGVRQVLMRPSDPDLYVIPQPVRLLREAHEVQPSPNIDWSTTGTTVIVRYSLKTSFARHNLIRCMKAMMDAPGLRTTYNDSDTAIWYSGPTLIGYTVKINSRLVLDHSNVADVATRRKYAQDVQKKLYGVNMPVTLTARSDGLSKYYAIAETVIDFTGLVDVFPAHDMVSGVDSDENIEVTFNCVGAVSSNVNFYCCLEYFENIDYKKQPNGTVEYRINQNYF